MTALSSGSTSDLRPRVIQTNACGCGGNIAEHRPWQLLPLLTPVLMLERIEAPIFCVAAFL
jgi:hypothetical protein